MLIGWSSFLADSLVDGLTFFLSCEEKVPVMTSAFGWFVKNALTQLNNSVILCACRMYLVFASKLIFPSKL